MKNILKFALVTLALVCAVTLAFRAGQAQGQGFQVCVDIPGAQGARVAQNFSAAHGYQPKVKAEDGTEVDNPVTRRQYMKQVLAAFVRESVKAAEANEAAEAARKAAAKKVDDELGVQE